jgi:hypothetical protein
VGPEIDGTAGLANPFGNALGSRIDGNPFFTLSHEFAHVVGRTHVNCPGMNSINAPFSPYPYPDGLLSKDFTGESAYFGTDVYQPYPRIFNPKKTHDLMSYCHPVWTSDYTWNGLKFGLRADFGVSVKRASGVVASSVGVLGDAMVVSGLLFPDGTAELNPILRATTEIDPETLGDYTIEVRDASDSVLTTRSFDPHADDEGSAAAFAVSLPYDAAAHHVALINGDAEVVSVESTPASPTVTITSPNGGETLSGSSARVEWTASDTDGDALTFAVQYSSDSGTTWETLSLDVRDDFFDVDLADIPGSDQALIRVLASDGFNTGVDVADAPFTTPRHAPHLSADGVTDYGVAVAGDLVFLEAFANDLEDGPIEGDAIGWSSSVDGPLGNGNTIELDVSGLTPGLHEISVKATDSTGEFATHAFHLNVYASEGDVPTCRGWTATHVGTDGPDAIEGTTIRDVIIGGPSADRLKGRGKNDHLCGQGGKDKIIGGAGRDHLYGGAGNDVLKGGPARDVLRGGKGKDRMFGGPASDRCFGGPSRDRFRSCEHLRQ